MTSESPAVQADPPVATAVAPKPDAKPRTKTPPEFRHIGGSDNDDFNLQVANAVVATAWFATDESDERRKKLIRAMAAAIEAFKPADEIEGMIAAQAVALHHASMECSRRAMIPDQGFEPAREYRKAAANASRAFVEMLGAFDRRRGKGGQQKVTVEHVHVHKGGQAIVGNVAPGGGGGAGKEFEGKPHAPPAALEHDAAVGTVLPPLRGAHTKRVAVPVARNGKRPL